MEKDKEMLCAAEEKHDDSVAVKAPERSHLALKRTIGIILVAPLVPIKARINKTVLSRAELDP